jgi:hypothetical protein
MKNQDKDINWYVTDPRTRKYLAQCMACGVYGIRPDAPEKFFGSEPLKKLNLLVMKDAALCSACYPFFQQKTLP